MRQVFSGIKLKDFFKKIRITIMIFLATLQVKNIITKTES